MGQGAGKAVPLDADLIGRAVIASAISYGDDPIGAMTAPKSSHGRRCLAPAAEALARVLGLTEKTVAPVLGLAPSTVAVRRMKADAAFQAASRIAEDALRDALRARAPVAPAMPAPMPGPTVVRRLETSAAPVPGDRVAVTIELPVAPARMAPPAVHTPLERLPDAPAVIGAPPNAGSRTAGKPAVAPPPRDRAPPSDLAERPETRAALNHEARFVPTQRAKRVPWPHIARQINKSEPDTRRLYDPEWTG